MAIVLHSVGAGALMQNSVDLAIEITRVQTRQKVALVEIVVDLAIDQVMKLAGVNVKESPNKSDVPAYLRKKKGGDWKTSTKDLEDEKIYDFNVDLNEVEIVEEKKIPNNIAITENSGIVMRFPPAAL